ncbi:FAD-dependent oxidoreductase [Rhizorhapis sp. SPR117]|uniref:FAD-dependent oxidoreductase n=1 Tax=Rhizorhapis sp. SPR117 TaxID=2912611 RepID=UPI001F40D61C|nr:FAD-binding protein [Rhizorhapis sp. SPR117]
MTTKDYDVIVVGGGGAGISAAILAHDAGAKVLLVEAGARVGGSTRLSGGVFYAAGTSVQEEAGIEDSSDDMVNYYSALNQHRVQPALVRALAENAAPTLEWLISLGVSFPVSGLYVGGVEGVARSHKPIGLGEAVVERLDAALSDRAIDVALKTRVEELLTDENGDVVGVRSDEDNVYSHAVILATGGFGNNRYYLNKYYPDALKAGRASWCISADTCVGDGLVLGLQVEAAIEGHNRGLLLVSPGFQRHLESRVPSWLIYVNRDGKRFVNEKAPYAVMSGVVASQSGRSCFAIFDEESRLQGDVEELNRPNWETSVVAEAAQKGSIACADSIEQLAIAMGIRASALINTIKEYNGFCDAGVDKSFFKNGELRHIKTPPFYGVEMKPEIIALTSAGLLIDSEAQVRSDNNLPIRGLFAAGEVTGGVLGERYVGSGNAVANAITFGRIAGASAARHCAKERIIQSNLPLKSA